jgi:peptidoglycan/LPS O-acetylase OafA/YrhL
MSEPKKAAEIRALSGARALPPLILVLFHFCEGHGYRGLPWFDLIAAKGYLWVEFFFALSGFILMHVYGSRSQDFARGNGYLSFLRARLVRLYPLHLFMIFAIFVQLVLFDWLAAIGGYVSIFHQPYHPQLTLPTFIANLFLVQAWNLFPYLSWNGVAWFVSVEFLLCLLFPLYLLASHRGGLVRGILFIALGVCGLTALDLTSRHGLDLTFHDGIWRGMSAFGVGVGLERVFRAMRGAVSHFPDLAHSLLQVAVTAWLLSAIWFTGWSHTHRDIWTVLPMFALVFVLAFDRGFLADLLGSRRFRTLGDWSYATYIGQTFWLQFFRFAEQRVFPDPNAVVFGRRWVELFWWPEPLLLVAVCTIWGASLTALIERPARDGLNRLLSGSAAPRAASSA